MSDSFLSLCPTTDLFPPLHPTPYKGPQARPTHRTSGGSRQLQSVPGPSRGVPRCHSPGRGGPFRTRRPPAVQRGASEPFLLGRGAPRVLRGPRVRGPATVSASSGRRGRACRGRQAGAGSGPTGRGQRAAAAFQGPRPPPVLVSVPSASAEDRAASGGVPVRTRPQRWFSGCGEPLRG